MYLSGVPLDSSSQLWGLTQGWTVGPGWWSVLLLGRVDSTRRPSDVEDGFGTPGLLDGSSRVSRDSVPYVNHDKIR